MNIYRSEKGEIFQAVGCCEKGKVLWFKNVMVGFKLPGIGSPILVDGKWYVVRSAQKHQCYTCKLLRCTNTGFNCSNVLERGQNLQEVTELNSSITDWVAGQLYQSHNTLYIAYEQRGVQKLKVLFSDSRVEKQMMLKHVVSELIEVEHSDLEELIRDTYNKKGYCLANDEELSNGVSITITVSNCEASSEDIDELDAFKYAEDYQHKLDAVMQDLCRRKLLDPGRYLINIFW